MLQLTVVPVLSDVVVTFFELIVLIPNLNFWIVPVSHYVSDMRSRIAIPCTHCVHGLATGRHRDG